ncbi:MAG: hypothetical protein WD382_06150 [Halofilum sp. (in: g-proteobacteria)]
MAKTHDVMIMGATYGSLLAIKLSLAGHNCRLICLPDEARVINSQGIRVRMPAKGREGSLEVDSREAPGTVSASGPDEVTPAEYDLVVLAMQEPQYKSPGVRELTQQVAQSGAPCMSIMNMPPLAYLARIPGLHAETLRAAYTEPEIWDAFDPKLMTLCSPDPQAFRPPEEPANVLQVSLPTNFRAARFASDEHTAILRDLERDIDAIRYPTGDSEVELPVKLRVHESVFVPLSKWSMLITGNYRCVHVDEMIPVCEAVHSDLERSRAVYEWVGSVLDGMGATEGDQVPFEKYAAAAKGLTKPSSAARALFNGAPNIERVDKLVRTIGEQQDRYLPELDEIVELVDARLKSNRQKA